MKLLTYAGQNAYYMNSLPLLLKTILHSYLIEEILLFTIDCNAVAFQCFDTFSVCCILAFCAAENGNKLILAREKSLTIWNTATTKRIGFLKEHKRPVTCCCALPSDKIVSGSYDSTLRVWDIP